MIDLDRTPLTDSETLVERANHVAMAVQALRERSVWDDIGDTGRRVLAKRLLFARFRCADRIAMERQANAARTGRWWPR
jgi:hypothetical protein